MERVETLRWIRLIQERSTVGQDALINALQEWLSDTVAAKMLTCRVSAGNFKVLTMLKHSLGNYY